MKKLLKIVSIVFLFYSSLHSYESEDKLKAVIVGKVAKYIEFKESNSTAFTITVLNNQFNTLFDNIYHNKTIQSKPVKIKYIQEIDDLNSTDILFISSSNSWHIADILQKIEGREILSISDLRGFAQKGGVLQLYFLGQKLKLKMNLDALKRADLDVDNTLLRIVEIVKDGN